MKKQNWLIVIPIFFLLIASVFTILITVGKEKKPETENEVKTFAEYTDCEVFQSVPLLEVEDAYYGEAADCGKKNYVIDVNGTSLEDYKSYSKLLADNGFEKHSDNGEDGINKNIYTSCYTKGEVVVTVTHMEKISKTYIIAGEKQLLSDRLVYDESFVSGNKENAKTSLHMLELHANGNSFVIQLKNGHFILNDGGTHVDLPYLLDYLEELTPGDEKPVVEAWIISHAHGDHMGAINVFLTNPENAERLYVEEVYFSAPNNEVALKHGGSSTIIQTEYAAKSLKTTSGGAPNVYRPITGQRYYFSDITMEVVFSQEFIELEEYSEDLNDSSTWVMYNIEGQKALLGGDGDYGEMKAIMRAYDKDYFKLDVFTNLHHGINVFDDFTDFCDITTVLVPFYETYGLWPNTVAAGARLMGIERVDANKYLVESVEEFVTGGGGTKVLTFPYKVGEIKDLGPTEWIYDNGKRGVGFPETVITK